ncbi:unnamed protein product [Chrysoparadoxa australica]
MPPYDPTEGRKRGPPRPPCNGVDNGESSNVPVPVPVPVTAAAAAAAKEDGASQRPLDISFSCKSKTMPAAVTAFEDNAHAPGGSNVDTVEDSHMQLAVYKGTNMVLREDGHDLYKRRSCPGPPVWRKQETVVQERIVHYTTIDEHGKLQELFETEKTQTEVLHMECKDTGDFAHRERTQYECGEKFNGEVVLQERGEEVYVHLKSNEDEYEHMESTGMPRHQQEEGGAPHDPSGVGEVDGQDMHEDADHHAEGAKDEAPGSYGDPAGYNTAYWETASIAPAAEDAQAGGWGQDADAAPNGDAGGERGEGQGSVVPPPERGAGGEESVDELCWEMPPDHNATEAAPYL